MVCVRVRQTRLNEMPIEQSAGCMCSDRGEGAELEATGLIEQVATPSRGPTAHTAGAGAVSARDGRLTAREELSGRSGDSRCAIYIHRSDSLESLQLWAPRLEFLGLLCP